MLSSALRSVIQRTSAGRLDTANERANFLIAIKKDIAGLVEQINTVYKPIVNTLISESGNDVLTLGLSGDVIKTSINATEGSAPSLWNSVAGRARSIKESVEYMLTELTRIENLVTSNSSDPTEVREFIGMDETTSTPEYSAHGDINYVSDGDSLELSIQVLDEAVTAAVDAAGDVNGPASATDNAVARFDSTTGKLLQNSTVTISDAGVITSSGVSTTDLTATGVITGIDATDVGADATGTAAGLLLLERVCGYVDTPLTPTIGTTFSEIFDTTTDLEANTLYKFDGYVDYLTSSVADGYIGISVPAGSTLKWHYEPDIDGIVPITVILTGGETPVHLTNCLELVGQGTARSIRFWGVVKTAGTSGRLKLMMAAKSSVASTIGTLSYLDAQKGRVT